MSKRILLAGLFHETNTFAPGKMGAEDFRISLGKDLFGCKGDGSPMGAFLEEAEKHDWIVVPTIDMRATPGAMPDQELVDAYLRDFIAAAEREAAAGPLDAIFLVLHGAMASETYRDVEGELISRIRKIQPLAHVPIFGVLDLHANFTPAMAGEGVSLVVYRENPHIDAAQSAVRAARLMAKALEEKLPLRTEYVPTDLVWPPTGTATACAPMLTLERIAREEERDGVEQVNVFAGFAHADTPHTGVSFSIVYDPRRVNQDRVQTIAKRLRDTAVAERALGVPDEWDLDAALDDALAKGKYPVCLVEPADNIGGGGGGDGTAILRALLRRRLSGGVILNDPETVAYLHTKAPGSIHELRVGGKTFPMDPGPVHIKARLVCLTDGNFKLEDRQSHAASLAGENIAMGPCAVVECDGVTILLTSRRTAPMDLGQWRSQGVEPGELRFIGVKAAVAYRRAYNRITDVGYFVRTPGPCTSDLSSLPYKHLRRPVFPLDIQ